MDLIINEATKKQILELINKYPGAFRSYDEASINMLEKNMISKELCITVLENVMYNCQCMRSTIKSHTIYDQSFYSAENIYLAIPKSSDYSENSGIFYEDVPEYKNMSNEILLSTLSNAFEAQDVYTGVLRHQSFTSRAERILQSIDSVQGQTIELSTSEKSGLESVYTDIKRQLDGSQNVDLQSLSMAIATYNGLATSIWNKYLNEGRCFLVHNYSRGHIENFIPSKYLSTSLLSDKFMALFQENNNNNYGFVVRPKKIVSAFSKDIFTHNRSENEGIDMYSSGDVPPILFPWEIEKDAIENSMKGTDEILNYDNGYVLPEIVLEDYELVGVYYRTNGEGKLSPSYEAASELARANGLELKEIDMSLARMQVGLQPMTSKMQKSFFLNIIRKYYVGEKESKQCFRVGNPFDTLEDEEIISKYLDSLYTAYTSLRSTGRLNGEALLNAITSTISEEDISVIKNFYERYLDEHRYLLASTQGGAMSQVSAKPQSNELSFAQQRVDSKRNDESDGNLSLNEKPSTNSKKPFAKRGFSELKIVQMIRKKNEMIAQQKQMQRQQSRDKTLVKVNSDNGNLSNGGFVNTLILSLITGFVVGAAFVIVYMIVK